MRPTQQYLTFYRQAEEILFRSGVTVFPVEPVRLAQNNGVLVAGYERFSAVSGIPMRELLSISSDGFCLRYKGRPIIVYHHGVSSYGRKRWTILHELSHILLGHLDHDHLNVYERREDVRRWMEAEADILTKCLIAPLPVALACGVKNEKELQRLFGLSAQAAGLLYPEYRALCSRRQILELKSERLLSGCSRFLLEWHLKQLEPSAGRHGSFFVTAKPEELVE